MEAGKRSENLEEKIFQNIHETKLCNKREGLFGQHETDFSGIKTVKERFEPFNKLWTLATQYYSRV